MTIAEVSRLDRTSPTHWSRALLPLAALAVAFIWLIVASDGYFRGILYTTLNLAGQVTLLTLPLAALIALLLARTDIPAGRVWPFLCAAPLILPSYVVVAGWDAIIGPIGWAKSWLPANASLTTVHWGSALLLHTLLALPGSVLLLALGFSRVEAELEETALLVWPWPIVLCRVTLRRAAPLFLAAGAWIFVSVSSEISVTDIYQIRTLAEELYYEYGTSEFRGLAAYIALLAVVAFVALSLAERSLRTTGVVAHQTVRRFSLGAAKVPLALLLATLLFLFVLVPFGSLIYKAGLHVEHHSDGRPFQTWSIAHAWGTLALSPRLFAPELAWTAQHALATTALTLILALALSWSERWRPALTPYVSLFLVLLIILPGPLLAIGLLKLLSNLGPIGSWLNDRTLFAPVVGAALRALPWVALLLRHAFRTLPQEQLEIARVHGYGPLPTLLAIAMPQRWPLLGAALIFSLALSVSEVSSTLLLRPPGVELASVRMMGMLHSGVDNQLAGLALLLVGCYVVALSLFLLFLRLAARRT